MSRNKVWYKYGLNGYSQTTCHNLFRTIFQHVHIEVAGILSFLIKYHQEAIIIYHNVDTLMVKFLFNQNISHQHVGLASKESKCKI